jgi:hypothetical protein
MGYNAVSPREMQYHILEEWTHLSHHCINHPQQPPPQKKSKWVNANHKATKITANVNSPKVSGSPLWLPLIDPTQIQDEPTVIPDLLT